MVPVIGAAVIVLVAATLATERYAFDRTPRRPPAPAPQSPGAGVTLVYGAGPLTFARLAPSPGEMSYPGIIAAGYPVRPLVVDDSVVYIADGEAWDISRARGFVRLGVATSDFVSVRPGWVWLAGRGAAGPTLREVRVDGAASGPQVEIPSGAAPIAAIGDGVLLRTADQTLIVWSPATRATTRSMGPVGSIVAARDPVMAFTSATCTDGADCDLHVVDVRSPRELRISKPPGAGGFDAGGALSPDGTTLAVFVGAGTAFNPTADLVMVDLRTAVMSGPIAGGQIAVGEPVGSATWSPSGRSLFFCGLDGPMRQYEPGAPAAVTLDQPSSYAFAATESKLIASS